MGNAAIRDDLLSSQIIYISPYGGAEFVSSLTQSNLLSSIFPGLKSAISGRRWSAMLSQMREGGKEGSLQSSFFSCLLSPGMPYSENNFPQYATKEESGVATIDNAVRNKNPILIETLIEMSYPSGYAISPTKDQVDTILNYIDISERVSDFRIEGFVSNEVIINAFPGLNSESRGDLAGYISKLFFGNFSTNGIHVDDAWLQQSQTFDLIVDAFLKKSVVPSGEPLLEELSQDVEDSVYVESLFIAAQQLALHNYRLVMPNSDKLDNLAGILSDIKGEGMLCSYNALSSSESMLGLPRDALLMLSLIVSNAGDMRSPGDCIDLKTKSYIDRVLKHSVNEVDSLRGYKSAAKEYFENTSSFENIPRSIIMAAQQVSHAMMNHKNTMLDEQVVFINSIIESVKKKSDGSDKCAIPRGVLYRSSAFEQFSPQTLDVITSILNTDVIGVANNLDTSNDLLNSRLRGTSLAAANNYWQLETMNRMDIKPSSIRINKEFVPSSLTDKGPNVKI